MVRVNTKFIILTSGVKRSGIIQELLWGTYGQNQGGGWRWGREVGLAGVGWRGGEKMQTTVIEQQ